MVLLGAPWGSRTGSHSWGASHQPSVGVGLPGDSWRSPSPGIRHLTGDQTGSRSGRAVGP